MKSSHVYDIAGIGIGPFNLGLAAMAEKVEKLQCIFFDRQSAFKWHPGMMLDRARLQVSFLSDLVTPVDPTSRHTFLNYLVQTGWFSRFVRLENPYPLRKEYNDYCAWVARQIPNLHFGMDCVAIRYHESRKIYTIKLCDRKTGASHVFHARHIVVGIGSEPKLPACAKTQVGEDVIHSANYLFFREKLLAKKNIVIVGSGQSAAEIFNDLLQYSNDLESLRLFSGAPRFFAMEDSKFAFEMTSPEYIQYFFGLADEMRNAVLSEQDALYKGIDRALIRDIYESLYAIRLSKSQVKINLHPGWHLKALSRAPYGNLALDFHHPCLSKDYHTTSPAVILATGYQGAVPGFLKPLKKRILYNENGHYATQKNYSVDQDNTLFVQNADLHTHGFNSADLGMGSYRNAIILNAIAGSEIYKTTPHDIFQCFGVPQD